MITDLDNKLTSALSDAATTTTCNDDALAAIMRRAGHRSRPPRRRRRVLVAGLTITALGVGAGATYAAVADRLTPDQAATIDWIPTCGLDTETARLVASTSGPGRPVEYWTVDAAETYGDFLFEQGDTGGGGGCGPTSRAVAHPVLPWGNYLLDDNGDGTGQFWFFGQAPAGTASVDIVTGGGTTHTDVTSPDGYFVTLAELPLPAGDHLERVDAYAADGTLLGTGGLG